MREQEQGLHSDAQGARSTHRRCPAGEICYWPASPATTTSVPDALPSGWLLCDGSEFRKDEYPELAAILGTTFGSPSDPSMCVLPALCHMTTTNRQRVVVGAGQGSGLTSRAVNDTGGAASVALVTAELPSHNHTITSGANVLRIVVSGGTRLNNAGTTYAQGDASINNAGTGDYHENRQPCLMMYAIIRT